MTAGLPAGGVVVDHRLAVDAQATGAPAAVARRRPVGALLGLAVATAAMFLLAVAVGSVWVPLPDTLRVLVGADPTDPRWSVVITQVRLPRAATAALAGTALGVAGLQMQTLFGNPLADPYSLGVSAGASLGVALVVTGAGGSAGAFTAGAIGTGRVAVVAAGAVGAAVVLSAVLLLARWVRSVVTLLVIGVIVGAAVFSFIGLLLTWTAPQRALQYWTWQLGSYSGVSPGDLVVFAPTIGAGLLLALGSMKPLNALLLGENYARTVGVHVRRLRTVTLLGASLLAGTVTAFCGPISFLGIAVPHLARRLLATADHRVLLPACALAGAVVSLFCSIVAQVPGTGLALPINIVASLIGAPIVIAVLLRASSTVARTV
ncbi:iron ABC transporter permease [Frankia sp. AgPm24]|nr:iron ABC transporter permease [Frankia sp. AgPm24]MCK9921470.1 iron ABC transporter permease [Frankia sp. AgPm24]